MDFEYKVDRKPRRRTLSIVISHTNQIVVKTNRSLSDEKIADFVNSKRNWISRIVKLHEAHLKAYKPKKFIDGEKFLYLGKEIILCVKPGECPDIRFQDNRIFINLPRRTKSANDFIKNKLIDWYKIQSIKILKLRLERYYEKLNVKATNIKIRTLKRTWASCSRQGVLTFSWKLIMAPLFIVDYVVVHELAHRIHHNHSSRFWKQVGEVIPEYKACKRWLRANENRFRW